MLRESVDQVVGEEEAWGPVIEETTAGVPIPQSGGEAESLPGRGQVLCALSSLISGFC